MIQTKQTTIKRLKAATIIMAAIAGVAILGLLTYQKEAAQVKALADFSVTKNTHVTTDMSNLKHLPVILATDVKKSAIAEKTSEMHKAFDKMSATTTQTQKLPK